MEAGLFQIYFFHFDFYLSKFSSNNLRCSQSQKTDLVHLIFWAKINPIIAGHIWQVVARPLKHAWFLKRLSLHYHKIVYYSISTLIKCTP